MSQDSPLVNQLLGDILTQQRDNATTLGRIDQTVADLKDSSAKANAEMKESHEKLAARVSRLERKDLKRASFFAGILVCVNVVWEYFKNKLHL